MRRAAFSVICVLMYASGEVISSEGRSGCQTDIGAIVVDSREVVAAILAADMTPKDRMKALECYLDLGRSMDEVERLLGKPYFTFGFGPFFGLYSYGTPDKPGLNICCYPDDKVASIMYRKRVGVTVILRSDDPITWPKTMGRTKKP